jgi:hypothetical protein
MEPPKNVEIYNGSSALWWIDGERVLCAVSKKGHLHSSREQATEQLEALKKMSGGDKLCMLMDITHTRPRSQNRDDREFIATEMAKIVKAMAIISNSALGKMMVNLFFNLKPPPYPAKMFNDEHEARKWLGQYR